METITTAIEFVASSKLPSTGDFLFIGIIFCIFILSIALFVFWRKSKKLLYASAAGLSCVLLCFCMVGISKNIATADKFTDCVPSKIAANVGSDVSIENGYIKYFNNDSVLALHGINVSSTENINCNWKIFCDDELIYDNQQVMNNPIYIDNSKNAIKVSTDMDVDTASRYIGKSPVCLDFVVQEECRVTGKVTTKSGRPFEGVSAQFVSNDNETTPAVLTDKDGNYTLMVKQGSTGHVHFTWMSQSKYTENFIVNGHVALETTEVYFECPLPKNNGTLNYTGSEKVGVEFGLAVEVVSGTYKATDIGEYSVTVRPHKGFYWPDGTNEEKTYNWKIQGAYVKKSGETLTFYFGTKYSNGDYLVLDAEHAQEASQIPWKSEQGAVLGNKVVFDPSMKNYSVSQTAWWFEGGGLITEFVDMNNLTLALDPNKRGMESMFNGCWRITTLNLSSLNTENCKSFIWMFYNCINLSSLNLGNFNTESAEDMYHMFDCCVALENLDLSSFNTKNVEDMSYMFGKNPDSILAKDKTSQLKTIKFGENFDTSKVSLMDHMFYQCALLSKINSTEEGTFDLSNFDFSNAVEVSWFISGCDACTNVIWGDVVFIENSSIYGFMAYCINLVTADCSGLNTAHVSWLDEAFRGDSALATIYCKKDTVWNGEGNDIFTGDTALKGGNNTSYDSSHTDITYAREDTAGNPGYFTAKQ